LTPNEAARKRWRALAERYGLPVVADLTSCLDGEDVVLDRGPVLRGTLTGLERGRDATGPTFEALVNRVAAIVHYDPAQLYSIHERLCPAEIVIHLDRLARTFDVRFEGSQAIWEPGHLPRVLDYLPEATPLGLYGRGPNWLYVAVALLATPAPFYQFDPRLGWARSASLSPDLPGPEPSLQFQLEEHAGFVHIEAALPRAYLDYSQLDFLTVPPLAADLGVVLSGKLPHWLYTSLALTYRAAPWIAVYQPQLAHAVVVYSADRACVVGDLISGIQSRLNRVLTGFDGPSPAPAQTSGT
jgi:CRISPR-associated protein Csx3